MGYHSVGSDNRAYTTPQGYSTGAVGDRPSYSTTALIQKLQMENDRLVRKLEEKEMRLTQLQSDYSKLYKMWDAAEGRAKQNARAAESWAKQAESRLKEAEEWSSYARALQHHSDQIEADMEALRAENEKILGRKREYRKEANRKSAELEELKARFKSRKQDGHLKAPHRPKEHIYDEGWGQDKPRSQLNIQYSHVPHTTSPLDNYIPPPPRW